jgi:hypothetical protein
MRRSLSAKKPPHRQGADMNTSLSLDAAVFQVNFDISTRAVFIKFGFGAVQELSPINGLCMRVVIEFSDFVEVHKFMSGIDQAHNRIRIDNRLKADPRLKSRCLGKLEGGDAVSGQRCAGLPVQGFGRVVCGESRSPDAASLLQQFYVTLNGPQPSLGQNLGPQVVFHHDLESLAGELKVFLGGLVHVTCKAHEDKLPTSRKLLGILGELCQGPRTLPYIRGVREEGTVCKCGRRGEAVGAGVRAALVEIGRKGRIFAGFASGLIDDGHVGVSLGLGFGALSTSLKCPEKNKMSNKIR